MTNRSDEPGAAALRLDETAMPQPPEPKPGHARDDTPRRGEGSGAAGDSDAASAFMQPGATAPGYRRSLFRR